MRIEHVALYVNDLENTKNYSIMGKCRYLKGQKHGFK